MPKSLAFVGVLCALLSGIMIGGLLERGKRVPHPCYFVLGGKCVGEESKLCTSLREIAGPDTLSTSCEEIAAPSAGDHGATL